MVLGGRENKMQEIETRMKKIYPTRPHNNECFCSDRNEKKKQTQIDKQQWVLVFVNTSFFVIYGTIQAAEVLIAVCHFFYEFPLLAYKWT